MEAKLLFSERDLTLLSWKYQKEWLLYLVGSVVLDYVFMFKLA